MATEQSSVILSAASCLVLVGRLIGWTGATVPGLLAKTADTSASVATETFFRPVDQQRRLRRSILEDLVR